jgi:hypothetical protein
MVEKAKKQGSFVSPPVATISESSGIPKRKYFPQRLETELRPLFTGQVFIVAEGLPRGDSRGATGGLGWRWCSRSAASHSRCDPNDKGRRVANAPSFKPDR